MFSISISPVLRAFYIKEILGFSNVIGTHYSYNLRKTSLVSSDRVNLGEYEI